MQLKAKSLMELQNHPLAQYSKLPDAWNKEILVVQSTHSLDHILACYILYE